MRRSSSDRSDGAMAIGEEDMNASMFLIHQNKALAHEMRRYKRQIAEAKKELELMRNKSREMESLVSVIQRSWSQLDIDASLLLDGLGDSEMVIDDNENFKILSLFLTAGQKHRRTDPTNASKLIPKFDTDEWSNAGEINAEKNRLQAATAKLLADSTEQNGLMGDEEEEEEEDLGSQLEEHLLSHASFTMALLERLCIFIAEAGIFERAPEIIHALSQAREMHGDRLVLQDRIQKLLQEIVELEATLQHYKQQKERAERNVDRLTDDLATLKASSVNAGVASGDAQGGGGSQIDPSSAADPNSKMSRSSTAASTAVAGHDSEAEQELRQKINLLEQQLTESETAKSKVEMTLTERLARPLTQTEAQIADMRKSMEELRQQCKQRVASLIAEGTELQEKVTNLELGMMQLEAACANKCEELVAATKSELDSIRKECDLKQSDLLSAQAELSLTTQLQSQVEEYQTLESTRKAEILRLQDKVRVLSANTDQLTAHLRQSREKEVTLEHILIEAKVIHDDWIPPTTETPMHTLDSASMSTAETPGIDASLETRSPAERKDEFSELILRQAQGRARDLHQELEDARANMDDLILEIEAVSAEERKVADQCTRLLAQMQDSQSMQRGVLEENLRLHDQVADIQKKLDVTVLKFDNLETVMRQQDGIISHMRQTEQALRSEVNGLKKSAVDTVSKRHVSEQDLLEAQQKYSLAGHTLEAAKKRNMELQARCDELGKKLEAERKLRMEAQRDAKSKKKDKDKDRVANEEALATTTVNGGGGGVLMATEDVEMLEITLGMLRCSVCRDRFKEVAITRCFHLFCRDCIDENIRNRHRKCPACGEKFGQDDVRTIYFTH